MPPRTLTEPLISVDAGEGEPRTLEGVIVRYGEFIGRSLYRFGIRPPDVPDLTQEVLLVVHRRSADLAAIGTMRGWLYGVCRKVASTHRRRAIVRREITVDVLPERTAEKIEDASHAVETAEHRARLHRVLDAMDLERRALIVMFEIEELDCAQIAAQLGIPVGTVYSRLNKARAELKRCYARDEARQRGRHV
jgi:RNA polymerase sigma-70 factor, ECF subfamily